MQIQLIALFLSFNFLVISAAEETVEQATAEAQASIHLATCVTGSIEQLKAEHTAQIAKYEQFMHQRVEACKKTNAEVAESQRCTNATILLRARMTTDKTELDKTRNELEKAKEEVVTKLQENQNAFETLTTQIATKQSLLLTEILALDALTVALEHTPCIDIGGIREPLCCSIYNLSGESHVTLNADPQSIPNFLFGSGLDFGKLLRTFPEVRTILLRRRTPANCLISHVGVNIFDDVLGQKLRKKVSCDIEDMVNNYELLVEILPEFVSDFAEFLKLFKGGCFTYKSLKKGTSVGQGYFVGDMRGQPIENYVCMLQGEPYELDQFSFSQPLADVCPHEELFYRILTEALGVRATTKINFVIGDSIGIYSQTVVNIPREFTGEIDHNKLSEVFAWFLSKKPIAVPDASAASAASAASDAAASAA